MVSVWWIPVALAVGWVLGAYAVADLWARLKPRREAMRCAECDCDNPPKGCNWIEWEGDD